MPRTLRRIAMVLVGAVVVEYLVLPQIAGARRTIDLLGGVNPGWLLAGVVLEVCAVVSYAQLTRSLLPATDRISLGSATRVTLATLGISHVVPGGTAAGASLGYRLLTSAGVTPTDAGFALATQGLGSAVVLNMLLWIGLVVSIPLRGFNPLYGTAAVLGALLLGGFAFAVISLTRGEERAAAVARRVANRVPFVDADGVNRVLHRVADRLRGLLADRRLLARAAGWAALNWLFDAASLWVFLAAFGYRASPDGLLVGYGLAYVLAAIPVSPGGLGVVEAVLTSTLVGFGAPRGVAILGVVSYRLVNFWLPIPLGGAAYVSLRVDRRASRRAAVEDLKREAAEAVERAPSPAEWAGERGLAQRGERR